MLDAVRPAQLRCSGRACDRPVAAHRVVDRYRRPRRHRRTRRQRRRAEARYESGAVREVPLNQRRQHQHVGPPRLVHAGHRHVTSTTPGSNRRLLAKLGIDIETAGEAATALTRRAAFTGVWADTCPPAGTFVSAGGQFLLAAHGHFHVRLWAFFHVRRPSQTPAKLPTPSPRLQASQTEPRTRQRSERECRIELVRDRIKSQRPVVIRLQCHRLNRDG